MLNLKLHIWDLSFWIIDLYPNTNIIGCIVLDCSSWLLGKTVACLREQPSSIQMVKFGISTARFYTEGYHNNQASSNNPISRGDPNQL